MTLDPQQSRVYRFVKDHPGSRMDVICIRSRASKASMRISEINYMARKEKGEDLIITSERDKFRWCHKSLNRHLRHTTKQNGDRLEITFK